MHIIHDQMCKQFSLQSELVVSNSEHGLTYTPYEGPSFANQNSSSGGYLTGNSYYYLAIGEYEIYRRSGINGYLHSIN